MKVFMFRSGLALALGLLMLFLAKPVSAGSFGPTTVTLTKSSGWLTTGTVTYSWSGYRDDQTRQTTDRLLTVAVTSNTSGTATFKIPAVYGTLKRFVIQSELGSTSATNAFDVTAKNLQADDVFSGQGANVTSAAGIDRWTSIPDQTAGNHFPVTVAGFITVSATNVGNVKKFYLYLFF